MDPATDHYVLYYYLTIANVEPHCSRPRNHQMSQEIGKDDLVQQISLRESFLQPSITIFRRIMLKLQETDRYSFRLNPAMQVSPTADSYELNPCTVSRS
jgi:hypothetical protein